MASGVESTFLVEMSLVGSPWETRDSSVQLFCVSECLLALLALGWKCDFLSTKPGCPAFLLCAPTCRVPSASHEIPYCLIFTVTL